MRHRQLHHALREFAEEAAWQLASDVAEGAEVAFELEARRSRDGALYCYRPLTGDFIDERTSLLGRLGSFLPAVHALEACGGLDAYLVAQGEAEVPREPRRRAEAVLRAFLLRVFADSSDFVLVPERLDVALGELDAALVGGRALAEVVVAVRGLVVHTDRIALGDGVELLGGAEAGDVPAELHGGEHALARLGWEVAPGEEAPLRHAQLVLRRLQTGLRLYDMTAVALAPTAWTRMGTGPWRPFALGPAGVPVRARVVVPPAQEDELRAFCALVARRTPKAGELAWALRRFDLALDAASPAEALTDALLALRALLEPEGPASGLLAPRVAALCAVEGQFDVVAGAVAHAVAVERAVVAGVGPDDAALTPLVDGLVGWLRAILRDLLCGHLAPEVRELADELLAERPATPAPPARRA